MFLIVASSWLLRAHTQGGQGLQGEKSNLTEQTRPSTSRYLISSNTGPTECKIPRRGKRCTGQGVSSSQADIGAVSPSDKNSQALDTCSWPEGLLCGDVGHLGRGTCTHTSQPHHPAADKGNGLSFYAVHLPACRVPILHFVLVARR